MGDMQNMIKNGPLLAKKLSDFYEIAQRKMELVTGDHKNYCWKGCPDPCDDTPVFLPSPITKKHNISALDSCENVFMKEGENVRKERRMYELEKNNAELRPILQEIAEKLGNKKLSNLLSPPAKEQVAHQETVTDENSDLAKKLKDAEHAKKLKEAEAKKLKDAEAKKLKDAEAKKLK